MGLFLLIPKKDFLCDNFRYQSAGEDIWGLGTGRWVVSGGEGKNFLEDLHSTQVPTSLIKDHQFSWAQCKFCMWNSFELWRTFKSSCTYVCVCVCMLCVCIYILTWMWIQITAVHFYISNCTSFYFKNQYFGFCIGSDKYFQGIVHLYIFELCLPKGNFLHLE